MFDRRIPLLIAKLRTNTISVAEKAELDAWTNASADNRRVMEWNMAPKQIYKGVKAVNRLNDERIDRNFERLRQSDTITLPQRAPVYIMVVKATVAAAIIVGAVVAIWNFSKSDPKEILSGGKSDAALRLAGLSKERKEPVLILQDGNVIQLETMLRDKVMERDGLRSARTGAHSLSFLSIPDTKDKPTMPWSAVVSVPFGQHWELSFPGGINVDVGPGTSLAIVKAGALDRNLALDGEAFFQIEPHAGSPLTVASRGGKVQVLGTTFNIQDYSEEHSFTTTLVSGAVKVSTDTFSSVLNKPGQETSIGSISVAGFKITEGVDTADRLAWRSPYFEFNNLDIRRVMKQVERWYGMKPTIFRHGIDTATIGLLGGGHVGKDLPLPTLLERLKKESHLSFQISGKTIIVSADSYTSFTINNH